MAEKERVDSYLHTLAQIEPDIHPVDRDASLTSVAISLKRLADYVQEILQMARFDKTEEKR